MVMTMMLVASYFRSCSSRPKPGTLMSPVIASSLLSRADPQDLILMMILLVTVKILMMIFFDNVDESEDCDDDIVDNVGEREDCDDDVVDNVDESEDCDDDCLEPALWGGAARSHSDKWKEIHLRWDKNTTRDIQ